MSEPPHGTEREARREDLREALREQRRAERHEQRASARALRTQIGPVQLTEEATPAIILPPPRPVAASDITALVELVEGRHGRPVTHISGEEVSREKGVRRRRRYVRHVLRFADTAAGEVVLFTKTALRRPARIVEQLEAFVSKAHSPDFRAPLYYGTVEMEDGPIGVWEFVAGRAHKFLSHFSLDDLLRMTRACGAMNAMTNDAMEAIPALPVSLRELAPMGEKLREVVEALAELHAIDAPPLIEAVKRVAELEENALLRLESIGPRLFSHQDIGSGNLVFPPDSEPLIVIDWESAYLGAPGASLRRVSNLKPPVQIAVAEQYVTFMEAHGYKFTVKDVLFAMGAVQVFYTMTWATRRYRESPYKSERALRWGLEHAPSFLTR